MLRILHTGDVHLDSPFSGLDPSFAEVRRNELRAAFTSMLHYAKCEKVDMILIAGDLFDADFVTYETLSLIKREFESIKCPIVISPGNHDYASESSVWSRFAFPDNTYIFTHDELEFFDFPKLGVRVWGWAFTSRTMEASPIAGKKADGEYINLLCGHGDLVSSRSGTCPLTVRELEAFGADYAALGHIHNPKEYTDRIAYCGCLEGRSFDEEGAKGALDVTLDGRSVTSRKVRFSKRRYKSEKLDVSGAASNGEIADRINEFIVNSRFGDDVILRIYLTGEVSPSFTVNTAVLESASDRVFALEVKDATLPMLDGEQLRRDPTLRGELYRVLEPALVSDDPKERSLAAEALRVGLAAIAGESIV